MPPHLLASTFTSRTYDQANNRLILDRHGNFDLTSIDELGTIGPGCRRIQSGYPVTGFAREVDPDPSAYHIEINQELPYPMQYRGIVFFDDPDRRVITRAAGYVKYITTEGEEASVTRKNKAELGIDLDQDETTWVVTKP